MATSSRSIAYRWQEDGAVRFVLRLPDGQLVVGSAETERLANTVIGAAARVFGASTTTIIARHPNDVEVASA